MVLPPDDDPVLNPQDTVGEVTVPLPRGETLIRAYFSIIECSSQRPSTDGAQDPGGRVGAKARDEKGRRPLLGGDQRGVLVRIWPCGPRRMDASDPPPLPQEHPSTSGQPADHPTI